MPALTVDVSLPEPTVRNIGGVSVTILYPRGSVVPTTNQYLYSEGLWAAQDYGVVTETKDLGEEAIFAFVGEDDAAESVFLVPLFRWEGNAKTYERYVVVLGYPDWDAVKDFLLEQFGQERPDLEPGTSMATKDFVEIMSLKDLKEWVESAKLKNRDGDSEDEGVEELYIEEFPEPNLYVQD